jgi:hypothetical protein
VKLTMPSYDIGAARILVDGHHVGNALGHHTHWGAYLWPVADQPKYWQRCEKVRARKLRDLRTILQRRLEDQGPWWTPASPGVSGQEDPT